MMADSCLEYIVSIHMRGGAHRNDLVAFDVGQMVRGFEEGVLILGRVRHHESEVERVLIVQSFESSDRVNQAQARIVVPRLHSNHRRNL